MHSLPTLHPSNTKFQLRSNLNFGIFNKGKASSPLNLGHGEQNRIPKLAEYSKADDIFQFLTLHLPNENSLPKGIQRLQ